MLIALRLTDNKTVHASLASETDTSLVCPHCQKAVRLAFGSASTRHFIHTDSAPCVVDAGESEDHRRAKSEIYEALLHHPETTDVHLERAWPSVRSDIFVRVRGVPIAIEVQISTLSEESIAHRTAEYARLGISVLWLLLWTPELHTNAYSPRRFERWLHATYFGRVYYWRSGLNVIPYRFLDRIEEVPERRWRDERGRPQRSRGFSRISKRYKMPLCGRMLHIVHDFTRTTRSAWSSAHLTIPAANLYMDRSRNAFPE
jgi:competence protein CoiA